jgi:hypothetical protein
VIPELTALALGELVRMKTLGHSIRPTESDTLGVGPAVHDLGSPSDTLTKFMVSKELRIYHAK